MVDCYSEGVGDRPIVYWGWHIPVVGTRPAFGGFPVISDDFAIRIRGVIGQVRTRPLIGLRVLSCDGHRGRHVVRRIRH